MFGKLRLFNIPRIPCSPAASARALRSAARTPPATPESPNPWQAVQGAPPFAKGLPPVKRAFPRATSSGVAGVSAGFGSAGDEAPEEGAIVGAAGETS